MATTFTRPRRPADVTQADLVCVLGQAPRFVSADEDFAIWPAEGEDGPLVLRGPIARATGGDQLRCRGQWKEHPTHGWAFQVSQWLRELPRTEQGVINWMCTRVQGVGPATAQALVDRFGPDGVFAALDADPHIAFGLPTRGGRKVSAGQSEAIAEAWGMVRAQRELEAFLFSHGVTASMADRLYKAYGDQVFAVLTETPYRICELRGVGFQTADQIARSLGVEADDPERICAGLEYTLNEAETQGDVFLGLDQLVRRGAETLGLSDPSALTAAAASLTAAERLVVEPDEVHRQRIYRRRWWERECRVARMCRDMLTPPPVPLRHASPDALGLAFSPTTDQLRALEMCAAHRLSLLTGSPGTGKSALQDLVRTSVERAGGTVRLCAPTGKAARRLAALTGQQATTVHRLLEWQPEVGGFTRDESAPIEGDLVICDEASMLSLDLAEALVAAIGPNTHLLLVGDPDQLPPVGAGRFLADLIDSEVVPRVHLTEIFRQAAKSLIITNAHRINHGEMPMARAPEHEPGHPEEKLADFFFVTADGAEQIATMTCEIATKRLPTAFGFDPVREVMVLAPMRKGPCGLERLNRDLQAELNPDGKAIPGREFRVGDRIIQNQNDYTRGREVMNGEIGWVTEFVADKGLVVIRLEDGRSVDYPTSDLGSFSLAWAISIHKSQGSQFPCVVSPVASAHYVMLSRSLVYTAITRAESMCVLVGETRAVRQALGRTDAHQRNSALAERLVDPNVSGELL